MHLMIKMLAECMTIKNVSSFRHCSPFITCPRAILFVVGVVLFVRIARENEMRMHWMATGFVVAISIACLGGLGDCAHAQDAAQKLTGIAAWNQLVGNSITGKEDGETLVEYYAPDGTAKSMRGNEISTGHWALVGETICFRYADEKEME